MKRCKGESFSSIVFDSDGTKNLFKTIDKNREEFISYLHKIGVSVSHNSHTSFYQNHSTTILTLKTTCFKVDFNDNSVKISPLK